MMNRTKSVVLVGLLVVPALAFKFGGWAVLTVQDVPEYAVAGTPMEVSYDLRQHGVGLVDANGGGMVTASSGTQSTAAVFSTPLGHGRNRAMLTFPSPGKWSVNIKTGWGPSGNVDLLPITVVATGAPVPAPMPPMNRGHQLFIAKGCVTCHTHQLTKNYPTTNVAPDLSEPKFMSSYLTKFLADPTIKTTWANANRMPNLGLKPAEISSLVAFLNREAKAASSK